MQDIAGECENLSLASSVYGGDAQAMLVVRNKLVVNVFLLWWEEKLNCHTCPWFVGTAHTILFSFH
jgi:hypothetical protein